VSLHSGIDTIAFVSGGVYTVTYGASTIQNICNLFASYGMVEDAPEAVSVAEEVRTALRGWISRRFPWAMRKIKQPYIPKVPRRIPVRKPVSMKVKVKKVYK